MIINGELSRADALACAEENLGSSGHASTTYVYRDLDREQWVGCQRYVDPGVRRFELSVLGALKRTAGMDIHELRRLLIPEAQRCRPGKDAISMIRNTLQTLSERGQVKHHRASGWGLAS